MALAVWEEWDGNGFDDAVAWAVGHHADPWLEWKSIRQLGVEFPPGSHLELVQGYIGFVGGDIVPDVCNAAGVSWVDDEVFVDADTIRTATFAVFGNLD